MVTAAVVSDIRASLKAFLDEEQDQVTNARAVGLFVVVPTDHLSYLANYLGQL